MENNITVTITGFKTIQEARQWVSAYGGGVEQDMAGWVENGNGYAFPFNSEASTESKNNIIMPLTHPDTYGK